MQSTLYCTLFQNNIIIASLDGVPSGQYDHHCNHAHTKDTKAGCTAFAVSAPNPFPASTPSSRRRISQYSRPYVRVGHYGDWAELSPSKPASRADGAATPTGSKANATRELHRPRVREGGGKQRTPTARSRRRVLPASRLEPRGDLARGFLAHQIVFAPPARHRGICHRTCSDI